VLALNDTLYGTTSTGGGGHCGEKRGCGTVFSYNVGTSIGETILYRFQNGQDGANPYSGVIAEDNILYGTTYQGGGCPESSIGCGTVFAVNLGASGAESVIYRFMGGQDGASPLAGLIAIGGNLYGTTIAGGTDGTVYQVTSQGDESVLYRFSGGRNGREPQAPLIQVNNALFGTTTGGGLYPKSCNPVGCGTIFSLTPGPSYNQESVVHRFQGGKRGADPMGSVTDVNGQLYGTTYAGGGTGCAGGQGCGTLFTINPSSGEMRTLYRFKGVDDGAYPDGNLLFLNGVLYGTTASGGGQGCRNGVGCGTVFAFTPSSSALTIVYAFKGGMNGQSPTGLTAIGGMIYGSTASGGGGCKYNLGCGTLFSVTP
jgi:uncharacterized repeat protein (TIGR03803 family)